MIYLTSDLHIHHANIIKYCNRPFASIDAMNVGLIKNINDTVGANDTLCILGDITFSKDPKVWADLRSQINCNNIDVCGGNHDYVALQSPEIRKLFRSADLAHIIHISKRKLIYCHHYRCDTWLEARYGSWHAYGHSHQSKPFALGETYKRINVGVDAWNYRPVSIEQLSDFAHKSGITFQIPNERF